MYRLPGSGESPRERDVAGLAYLRPPPAKRERTERRPSFAYPIAPLKRLGRASVAEEGVPHGPCVRAKKRTRTHNETRCGAAPLLIQEE